MSAGDTPITLIGNLTADPELRFTPSGAAVSDFQVASTPRVFNTETQEWKDGNTLFLRCSIWRQAAENVAESLRKGDRVIVTGSLKQRSYENKEGEKRTVFEVNADEVGRSLKFHPIPHGGGQASRSSGDSAPPADPWASTGGQAEEPPF